jgi:CheY-like chemotaxis protein
MVVVSSTRKPAPASHSPNKKTVLCIDDQPEGLAVRKIFLETFGYEVLLAGSGREGLRLLQQHAVDILLLDYRMPEMDGEAVAREVRKRWAALPIVMLSGYVAEIPPDVHLLVNRFVSKGSPPGELLETLQDLLGQLPKKPAARFSEYDLVQQRAQEQIERSRALIAQNRDRLAESEKQRRK